jgi:hypothetical protein
MGTNDDLYKKVITSLGEHHNEPPHPSNLSARIMERIATEKRGEKITFGILAMIFGWTLVPWVRRTMTVAALLLVVLFGYQQLELIAGLKDLSAKMSENVAGIEVKPASSGGEYRSLLMLEGRFSSRDSVSVSVNDIQNLINSYQELEESYEKIYRILKKNPELLQRIEKEFGETLENIEFKTKI